MSGVRVFGWASIAIEAHVDADDVSEEQARDALADALAQMSDEELRERLAGDIEYTSSVEA